MKYCKPSKTPFLSRVKLEEVGSSPMVNNTLYRQLIGCLLYLTHTRPELSYAVSVASRYMDQPHEIHWRASKRILNFVQGTRTHGIFYKEKSDLELVGFINSDWAGDNTDQKSTSRYVFMLVDGPISWSSKKQSAIALSSTEAEYRVVNAATQCLWLQGILGECGFKSEFSTIIYCENQSTI